jgi:hypothetical protein
VGYNEARITPGCPVWETGLVSEADSDRGPRIRSITREDVLASDPLAAFHVWWDDIIESDVRAFEGVLADAGDEKPLQRHLTDHPMLLAQFLDGGHGRWVIPHKDLGGRFEADFIVGHRWSGPTWEWILVELQTPRLATPRNRAGKLFLKNGRMCEQLDEGLRQINEWRRWIAANRDTAQRDRTDMGLGLTGIAAQPPGLLLIGREADVTAEHAQMRQQLGQQFNVKIHSFDWLVRSAKGRVGALRSDAPPAGDL